MDVIGVIMEKLWEDPQKYNALINHHDQEGLNALDYMIASDQGHMISQFIRQNQQLFLVDELIKRDLKP